MTSAEIARLANVSRSTVSRVLNQYDNVPEATRLKVQAVIDEHGYSPNHSARILAGKTNRIIGVFLADIYENEEDSRWMGVYSPYNMEMLSHLVQISKKNGYLTLIDTISDLSECETMEHHFSQRMLHGAVFIGFPYHTKQLEDMAKKGYNIVLVDQLSDLDDPDFRIKRANSDNIAGGRMATEYLLEQGHRNLLHVAGDDRLSSFQREIGFIQALRQAGIEETPVIYGEYRENIAYNEMKKYLTRNRPTGIFVANDIMVSGVMRAVKEAGLRIPEDISVIGYDNLQWSEWLNLELTTMDVSKEKLAQSAIDLLLSDETRAVCEPKIVQRSTVKPIET